MGIAGPDRFWLGTAGVDYHGEERLGSLRHIVAGRVRPGAIR